MQGITKVKKIWCERVGHRRVGVRDSAEREGIKDIPSSAELICNRVEVVDDMGD